MESPDLSTLREAAQRIAGRVTRTPLIAAPWAADIAPGGLWMKLETAQATGAFKLRGAANALACLPQDAREVVCCSIGNHGRAVTQAATARGLAATVCLSSLVPEAKPGQLRQQAQGFKSPETVRMRRGSLRKIVRRQGFWAKEQPDLGEYPAHLVGLIMRRICGEASAWFQWSSA